MIDLLIFKVQYTMSVFDLWSFPFQGKCGTAEKNYQPCTTRGIADKLFKVSIAHWIYIRDYLNWSSWRLLLWKRKMPLLSWWERTHTQIVFNGFNMKWRDKIFASDNRNWNRCRRAAICTCRRSAIRCAPTRRTRRWPGIWWGLR